MFDSKAENPINYSKKKKTFRETNIKKTGGMVTKLFLVHLLCPGRCISFFSSSFVPECPHPWQKNLMKQLRYKDVSALHSKYKK